MGQTKFSEKKIGSNKIPGQKKIWLKKYLLIKNFVQENILVKENFGPKCFRFLSKKLGRVNPGAGIYDPPPRK